MLLRSAASDRAMRVVACPARASSGPTLQGRGRIACLKLHLRKVPGDGCGRPLHAERHVQCQCFAVKLARALNVFTARAHRSEIAQNERLQTAISQALGGNYQRLQKKFLAAGGLAGSGKSTPGRVLRSRYVQVVERGTKP